MSALLGGGHSQLFGAQGTGLASAWQRAVCNEGVRAAPASQDPTVRQPRHALALRAVVAVAVLAVFCAVPWVMAQTPDEAATAAAPPLASPAAPLGGA